MIGDLAMAWSAKADRARPRARHPGVRLLGECEGGGRPGRLRLHRAGLHVRLRQRDRRPDLVYRSMEGWVCQRQESQDRVVRRGVSQAEFTDFVKSTYRVFLMRGLHGCYVYFMDAPTRNFFLSRIERAAHKIAQAAEEVTRYEPDAYASRKDGNA